MIYIDTENGEAVTSKEDYVKMNFEITGAENPAHNLQKTGFAERGRPPERNQGKRNPARAAQKKYWREDLLPERVKAGTMSEIDELKAARKENRELKAAPADVRRTRGKDEPETESERDMCGRAGMTRANYCKARRTRRARETDDARAVQPRPGGRKSRCISGGKSAESGIRLGRDRFSGVTGAGGDLLWQSEVFAGNLCSLLHTPCYRLPAAAGGPGTRDWSGAKRPGAKRPGAERNPAKPGPAACAGMRP